MHLVGVVEAKNRLTALLNEVEGGGEVIITRRGKPIARLAPLESGFKRAKARAAADGLRAASQRLSLSGLTIRDLVSKGRR
ncbi:MAG: type II toxin-antitoxin system prevent-host-death family antitoxin [Alphaproteobacteria bacterium PA2]|nr:MAG: type II toxin-antitoxin system prevent-host-death family antitoxin [Alphaproteobacteria bacterium PA2]